MGCVTDASLLSGPKVVLESDIFRWSKEGTTSKCQTELSGHLLALPFWEITEVLYDFLRSVCAVSSRNATLTGQ